MKLRSKPAVLAEIDGDPACFIQQIFIYYNIETIFILDTVII